MPLVMMMITMHDVDDDAEHEDLFLIDYHNWLS